MVDRIMLMDRGKVVLDGPPEQVWRHPVDVFSATFFGDCTQLQGHFLGVVRVGLIALLRMQRRGAAVDVVIRHSGYVSRRPCLAKMPARPVRW